MSDSTKVSTLDEIQAQIFKTACPNCKENKLDLRLRCDLEQGECLYLVKCSQCQTNYTIGAETRGLATRRPTVSDLLSLLTCQKCGSTRTELGFQCDLATHGCFYTITCRTCNQVIKAYK